ncbi:MAG: WD40 repeat domain-containing protein [Cyclobacteriaceae bacterium]
MNKVTVSKLHTLTGHKDSIYTLTGIDGKHFLSGSGDGMAVIWDLETPGTGHLLAKVPASIYALKYHPYRKQVLLGQNFEGIHYIDIASKKEIKTLKLNNSAIFDLQYFGNTIIAATGSGIVFLIDWESNTIVHKINMSDKSARTIAINYHKEEFAVGYSDHSIRIFNWNNYQLKKEIKSHKNSVFTLKYSPDEKFLLSAGRDAQVKIWDAEEAYQQVESIVAHMYAINDLHFSPNGKHFVTCSMDKSIKVWDAETFRLLKVIDKARHAGHGTSVNKVYWSAYGDQMVSCSDDRTISVWDIKFDEVI